MFDILQFLSLTHNELIFAFKQKYNARKNKKVNKDLWELYKKENTPVQPSDDFSKRMQEQNRMLDDLV